MACCYTCTCGKHLLSPPPCKDCQIDALKKREAKLLEALKRIAGPPSFDYPENIAQEALSVLSESSVAESAAPKHKCWNCGKHEVVHIDSGIRRQAKSVKRQPTVTADADKEANPKLHAKNCDIRRGFSRNCNCGPSDKEAKP